MRTLPFVLTVLLLSATAAAAQKPDTTRADSTSRARSPTKLASLGAVGDLLADLSPKGSTQRDGSRLGVREVELAAQAVVDPYFRGDIFLGISDLEKISIKQAFLTATALPWRLEARLGRFLMPIGKQNTIHRHDLTTVEHSYVVQRFLSPEGLSGTGVYLTRAFSPFGFYQELILTAVDRFGPARGSLVAAEPANKKLAGLGFSARLRNYWDLSESSNLELSASAATGRREQPLTFAVGAVNAAVARQSLLGMDVTYRWRPPQRGSHRSFLVQGELMKQLNNGRVSLPAGTGPIDYLGPTRPFTGAYLFARFQLSQRNYLGARYDWVQDPEADGARLMAGTALLEFFPSQFSKLVAAVERRSIQGEGGTTRLLLQASFVIGLHQPHVF